MAKRLRASIWLVWHRAGNLAQNLLDCFLAKRGFCFTAQKREEGAVSMAEKQLNN